jgi:hypothetical protein
MAITVSGTEKNILLMEPTDTVNPFPSIVVNDSVPGDLISANLYVGPQKDFGIQQIGDGIFGGSGVLVSAGRTGVEYRTVAGTAPDMTQTLENLTVTGASSGEVLRLDFGGDTLATDKIVQGHFIANPINISGGANTGTIVNGSTTHPFSNVVVTDSDAAPGVTETAITSFAYVQSLGDLEQLAGHELATISANSAAALTTAIHNFSYTPPGVLRGCS